MVRTVDEALIELGRMVIAGKLDRVCVAALHQNLEQVHAIRDRYQDELSQGSDARALR